MNRAPGAAGSTPILHVDMDAFYVGVEVRDDPSLANRPVVVGGTGDRGVVAAASYEARAFGIHSAMPTTRARRLCPAAIFLAGDHARYAEASSQVMALFGSVTPLVEPLSLDEAFLDVGGARRLFGEPSRIARDIRRRVSDEVGLSCSVGVAANKFLAKLASAGAKPAVTPQGPVPGAGVLVVTPERADAFLAPLPVAALWGVGPRTHERLERMGIASVGELAATPLPTLTEVLGRSLANHLHALALGRDGRRVEPDHTPKSIGHEETFARDHHSRSTLEPELTRLCDAVATRLRGAGMAARTVTLKVRYGDFTTVTRSLTPPDPLDSGPEIVACTRELLATLDVAAGVRLLGVSGSGLVDGGARQLRLDEAKPWTDADQAVDRIRERFGRESIVPAAVAASGSIRVKRRGEQQWGPDGDRADR